jgi:hypothetical protein
VSGRFGRGVLRVAFTLLLMAAAPQPQAAAQEAGDTLPAPAARVDTLTQGVSPRGAMLRSFALWGWGQASVGSYFRGGVWFSMEASTVYMLFRTIGRLRTAQEFHRRVVQAARDSLDAFVARDTMISRKVLTPPVTRNLENPAAYEQALSEAPGVATARKLVSARKQQRQDWVTYAVFFTLMSGVDAYVNAHLHDFPTTIASEVRRDGSLSLSVRVPLPAWMGGTTGRASASSWAYPRHRW